MCACVTILSAQYGQICYVDVCSVHIAQCTEPFHAFNNKSLGAINYPQFRLMVCD